MKQPCKRIQPFAAGKTRNGRVS